MDFFTENCQERLLREYGIRLRLMGSSKVEKIKLLGTASLLRVYDAHWDIALAGCLIGQATVALPAAQQPSASAPPDATTLRSWTSTMKTWIICMEASYIDPNLQSVWSGKNDDKFVKLVSLIMDKNEQRHGPAKLKNTVRIIIQKKTRHQGKGNQVEASRLEAGLARSPKLRRQSSEPLHSDAGVVVNQQLIGGDQPGLSSAIAEEKIPIGSQLLRTPSLREDAPAVLQDPQAQPVVEECTTKDQVKTLTNFIPTGKQLLRTPCKSQTEQPGAPAKKRFILASLSNPIDSTDPETRSREHVLDFNSLPQQVDSGPTTARGESLDSSIGARESHESAVTKSQTEVPDVEDVQKTEELNLKLIPSEAEADSTAEVPAKSRRRRAVTKTKTPGDLQAASSTETQRVLRPRRQVVADLVKTGELSSKKVPSKRSPSSHPESVPTHPGQESITSSDIKKTKRKVKLAEGTNQQPQQEPAPAVPATRGQPKKHRCKAGKESESPGSPSGLSHLSSSQLLRSTRSRTKNRKRNEVVEADVAETNTDPIAGRQSESVKPQDAVLEKLTRRRRRQNKSLEESVTKLPTFQDDLPEARMRKLPDEIYCTPPLDKDLDSIEEAVLCMSKRSSYKCRLADDMYQTPRTRPRASVRSRNRLGDGSPSHWLR